MLGTKRIVYATMSEFDKDLLERRLRNGDSINAIYEEGVYNRVAINKLIRVRKIPYEMKPKFTRRKKPRKPVPVKIEDVPRLCFEEMSDRIKNLNTLWRPTKNIGEQL